VASKGVPPHITLLYPWRTSPLRQEDIEHIAQVISDIPPFALTFAHIDHFVTTVFLLPEPQQPLLQLTQHLAQAFPECLPYDGQIADPIPHLTIASASTATERQVLEEQISRRLQPRLPLHVAVKALHIEEEGDDGMWSIRATLPLGRGM
jgi:2'-5' RNA ligase